MQPSAHHFTVDQAISILEADLPTLFERDLYYDLYATDIVFQDPINTFRGKVSYRLIFWALRFHSRLFFRTLQFDVHGVNPVESQSIRAEWTVRGTLRLPWQPQLDFGGYSLYRFNHQGQIDYHRDVWERSPKEIFQQFWRRGQANKNPQP